MSTRTAGRPETVGQSSVLGVPADMLGEIRRGAYGELHSAAADVLTTTDAGSPLEPAERDRVQACFALLESIGWSPGEQPTGLPADLVIHRGALLAALAGALGDAEDALRDSQPSPEQRVIFTRRVRRLQRFTKRTEIRIASLGITESTTRALGKPLQPASPGNGRGLGAQTVTVALSAGQVEGIIHATSAHRCLARVPPGRSGVRQAFQACARGADRRIARSLLAGLAVLDCFPADGSPMRCAHIARSLDMKPSVANRYLFTLCAAGLLEQDPETRAYRLATPVPVNPAAEKQAA